METNIIYGPPGTGKTTFNIKIMEELLHHYKPHEIAFVSYTRRGVNEGKDRAIEKFGFKDGELPFYRTLHSLAFRHCNFSRDDIFSRKDYKILSKALGLNFMGYYTEDLVHSDDRYLFLSELKHNNPKQFERNIEANSMEHDQKLFEYVEYNYKRYKREYGKFNFTDVIQIYLDTGQPLPVKVAIIDEAQDLTTLQWKMIEMAFSKCEKIYIAGDDDQAIYGWSGADVEYFLGLNGNKRVLDRSYRLPSKILDFSKKITKLIQNRVEKEYRPNEEGGSVEYMNHINEIDFNKEETWLILSRNNYYITVYEKELMCERLFYKNKGNPSMYQKDIDKIKIYNECRENKKLSIEGGVILGRLLYEQDVRLPWYKNFKWTKSKCQYYKDISVKGFSNTKGSVIEINTIHGVKGGEADNVVLITDVSKNIEKNMDRNSDNELRCLYVACTRAKKKLYILAAKKHNIYETILGIGENSA